MSRSAASRWRLLAVLPLVAALLTACATPAPAPPAPAEAGGGSFSASPECDTYVAAKDESLAEANQRAVQVSLADLPFDLTKPELVLCVFAAYTRDEPEDRALGFEMVVNAVNGESLTMFYATPGLTETDCFTVGPQACFTDTFGNVIVLDGSGNDVVQSTFGQQSLQLVGVQTTAAYRSS